MLRLTEDAGETFRIPATGERPPEAADQAFRIDSVRFAERALNQADRRMTNLLDLVRRFGLDAPGDGPRVA
jgi:hypothetical protein